MNFLATQSPAAWIEVMGWIGSVIASIFLIPQVFKILKTRSVKDVSFFTNLLLILGTIVWIVYGVGIGSMQVWVTNVIQFTFTLTIIIFKINYELSLRRKRNLEAHNKKLLKQLKDKEKNKV